MQSMHSSGMRCAKPSKGSACAVFEGETPVRNTSVQRLAAFIFLVVTAIVMTACSSGGGGDNGSANPRDDVTPQGLAFTYPFNGQQDVVLNSQMVVTFAGDVSGSMDDALELQVDGETAQPGIRVDQDDDQPNILRINPNGDLLPNTTYSVVATRTISGGNTRFNDGQTLMQFSTRPIEGRPADGDFQAVETTPGETNPVTGRKTVFSQFNTIRVRLNEPVDPATVNADTFTVTGPNGAVTDARITALGRYLVFDPIEDLAPGTYTIALSGDITSQFGKSLDGYSVERTVLSAGEMVKANLELTPSEDNVVNLPDNDLNGLEVNNINISSQLLGSNDQPASVSPQRGTVQTVLAEPGLQGYGDVIAATIRAGQKIQLTGLRLSLNGDVQTTINPSGPIDVNFINDVDVYLMSNDYRNIETPTAVRLRFDLGIGTLITAVAGQPGSAEFRQFVVQSLANGVFNQSALNIQAAGLAIPQRNGDLKIATVGTFPINVNRTDNATVDLELTLLLPNKAFEDQTPLQDDVIAPIVTAQSPSACLYVFGSPVYGPTYAANQSSPTVLPEQACNQVLAGGGLAPPFINSFPVESSPAITFSEPLDPASVNSNSIQLMSTGPIATTVPATYRVEGFSVVINPDDMLTPGTTYQITVNASAPLQDLAGNAVGFENAFGPGKKITFTTEPQIETNPTAPLLGTLSPGVPCALEGGDFMNGGDNAGHCVGDEPSADDDGNTANNDFPVFSSPANVAVDGFFSKLVSTDSIVLADGCLANGSGNTVADATVAVQEMDEGGQCVGAVPGELAIGNHGDQLTRSFSFRPSEPFQVGTRYWIVVCGTDGTSCTNQIVDDNGQALNTDPLNGTGSTLQSQATPADGGPTIVMPFNATEATENYYANQFTLPEADTNGNGQFDDGEINQAANRALVDLSSGGISLGQFPTYLSLTRPIAIGPSIDSCTDDLGDLDADTLSVDTDSCIQVTLLPGGVNSLTSINIGLDAITNLLTGLGDDASPVADIPVLGPILGGLGDTVGAVTGVLLGSDEQPGLLGSILEGLGLENEAQPLQTGRILLRFPNDADEGVAQSGYIVEKCTGTSGGQPYDYEPCFVANLDLIANAPDTQVLTVNQQRFNTTIAGPVTFEQNGRLVISLKNLDPITLNATALILPAQATIAQGNLNFQLVGSPTHGGREFPDR